MQEFGAVGDLPPSGSRRLSGLEDTQSTSAAVNARAAPATQASSPARPEAALGDRATVSAMARELAQAHAEDARSARAAFADAQAAYSRLAIGPGAGAAPERLAQLSQAIVQGAYPIFPVFVADAMLQREEWANAVAAEVRPNGPAGSGYTKHGDMAPGRSS